MAAKKRTLVDVLQEVKDDLLCYCVMLDYGSQDMGLDDTSETDATRECRVVASPAGFLGGLRICFQGTIEEVLAMDLYARPKKLPNPPTHEAFRNQRTHEMRPGAFIWGSDDSVRDWPAKLKKRSASQ